MKTPGVYVVEKSAFPNSVVEVATAIPAFVGYTEKAANGNKTLLNKPTRIASMAEFQAFFGGPSMAEFNLEEAAQGTTPDLTTGGKGYRLTQTKKYTLYYNMVLFFANGGGQCYIVSVGDYQTDLKKDNFQNGINALISEPEPTMVVVPEGVNLPAADCFDIQNAVLNHCGYDMRSRFAILDVPQAEAEEEAVKRFREGVTSDFLDFGAAYYPWLNTSIVQDGDLSFRNLANPAALRTLLEAEMPEARQSDELKAIFDVIQTKGAAKAGKADAKEGKAEADKAETEPVAQGTLPAVTAHKILFQVSNVYQDVLRSMKNHLNLLPPSAAIAGVYTLVDNTKGVWKAPANVGVVGVTSPTVNISHAKQEDLNVPLSGKAINAIRAFVGEGIKVWGARTLDGNSLDWRYINVRRTVIMLEESIKNAARAYVFEANNASTWVSVRSMIASFLTGIWKRGGLMGASPEEAFNVSVGLGETMTPNDVLEGIMRITVNIAVVRPAEFIEITFQQQLQEG